MRNAGLWAALGQVGFATIRAGGSRLTRGARPGTPRFGAARAQRVVAAARAWPRGAAAENSGKPWTFRAGRRARRAFIGRRWRRPTRRRWPCWLRRRRGCLAWAAGRRRRACCSKGSRRCRPFRSLPATRARRARCEARRQAPQVAAAARCSAAGAGARGGRSHFSLHRIRCRLAARAHAALPPPRALPARRTGPSAAGTRRMRRACGFWGDAWGLEARRARTLACLGLRRAFCSAPPPRRRHRAPTRAGAQAIHHHQAARALDRRRAPALSGRAQAARARMAQNRGCAAAQRAPRPLCSACSATAPYPARR